VAVVAVVHLASKLVIFQQHMEPMPTVSYLWQVVVVAVA
jgi:hypothetical protein